VKDVYAKKMPKDIFKSKIVLDSVEDYCRICDHISRMKKYFCAIRIEDRTKKSKLNAL
jgi:hypothetical protein